MSDGRRSDHPDELDELAGEWREGALTPGRHARLAELLSGSAEARARFLRQAMLTASLRELGEGALARFPLINERDENDARFAPVPRELGDAMVLPALSGESDGDTEGGDAIPLPPLSGSATKLPNTSRPPRPWPLWRAAAALVVVGTLVAAVLSRRGAEPPSPAVPAYATLVEQIDARWDGPVRPTQTPASLADEELTLAQGYARLELAGGAQVVVEAPARFRIESAGRLVLATGRLSAQVPPRAKGFTVRAGAVDVVDLGTEFGVDARNAAATRVQVFDGQVYVAPAAIAQPGARQSSKATTTMPTTAATARTQLISAGAACVVDAAGTVAPVPFEPAPSEPEPFVRVGQFDAWTNASADAPAKRWRAYAERTARDPGLALFYRFDGDDRAAGRLRNHASSTAGRYHLPLGAAGGHAPAWAEGRFPGAASLDFSPAAEQRLLLSDFPIAPARRITLTAWVFARTGAPFATIAKSWGATKLGQFHFGLTADGADQGVDLYEGKYAYATVREGASSPLPTGRWTHVAFVADGTVLRLYRDGREVASRPSAGPTPNPEIRSLGIGFKPGDDGVNPADAGMAGYWDGRLGELALYHRALSGDEIRHAYEAGRPE